MPPAVAAVAILSRMIASAFASIDCSLTPAVDPLSSSCREASSSISTVRPRDARLISSNGTARVIATTSSPPDFDSTEPAAVIKALAPPVIRFSAIDKPIEPAIALPPASDAAKAAAPVTAVMLLASSARTRIALAAIPNTRAPA